MTVVHNDMHTREQFLCSLRFRFLFCVCLGLVFFALLGG